MSEIIRDGTGQGYLAKVNANNRLYVNAVTLSDKEHSNRIGYSYNINTGPITLTSDAATPVLYCKNHEIQNLNIVAIAVGMGASTDGSALDIPSIYVVKNPTSGSIIDNAVNVDIVSNRNFGSTRELDANVYKGSTGDTLTGGTNHILFFQSTFGRLFATVDEILTRESSIGLVITPPAGNTNLVVYAAFISHLDDAKS